MFYISPSAIITIGFDVIEPYVKNNFEYVMIDGKEEPVHELMGLQYFGTRNVKHISRITRDNRIENLIGPNGETHTRAECGILEMRRKKEKRMVRTLVITMPDGEEIEYDSAEQAGIALGYSSGATVLKLIKRGTPHSDGWMAKYEERER